MRLSEYRKLVVAVIGVIAQLLLIAGVEMDPELSTALVGVAMAFGVWYFRNEPPL